MDEERLAEIDRQIEALGQPETSVEALLADLGGLDLDEADAILDELAEGQDIDIELAPLPRVSTSVSEPPTGVSESPPLHDAEAAPIDSTSEEPVFDLPPPSEMPAAAMASDDAESEENLLGSGLEDLGKSDIPEPLSPSLAAWIDPPDSETPGSQAPGGSAELAQDMPPNPKLPDLGGFEEDEEERTGLFSQEDIDAIRASQPPPPRSAPPPATAAGASIPPPVPDGPPPAASAPLPPIPMSVAPPSDDEELEILDDDDFELMIEEEGMESVDAAMDDVIDELIDDSLEDPVDAADDAADDDAHDDDDDDGDDPFGDATVAMASPLDLDMDFGDEPVIQEPEVEPAAEPAAAEGEASEGEGQAEAPEAAEEAEGEEGEKKGFFKKLFG